MRTLYTAQWVLPISSVPIRNGAVAVSGANIAFVGAMDALPADWHGATRIDLGVAVLMPGLVNTHTHLELTAMRGFLEGLAFRDWLSTLTRARRECFVAESLYDSACAGVEEALRNGITTCADTTESGEPLAAMRDVGVRGIGYLEVFGPNPSQCDDAIRELTVRVAARRGHDTALVRTGISPHAPYSVSAPLFTAAARLAESHQLPMAVHIAESHAESQLVRDAEGPFATALRARQIDVTKQARSPIALLEQCGVLRGRPLLIHAIQIDQRDVDCIAEHGATIAHCPISNLKLGHGIAPLRELRAAGIAVGLGTDSVASNDRMDMLGEARQAALLAALRQRSPDALAASDALRLATIDGARALRLENRIGSLEVGKAADLAAFALTSLDAQPVHDAATTLVHVLAGAQHALLTVVNGEVRVRDGVLLRSDRDRESRMHALGTRLLQWRATNQTTAPVS